MRFASILTLSLALLMFSSVMSNAVPVQAQGNARTAITLGITKDYDGRPSGSEESALPNLVRVGETREIFGRIMQLPSGRDFQPLPNVTVKLVDVFNNIQNPIVLATAQSDTDGYFVFQWQVSAKPFKKVGEFKSIEGITSTDRLRLTVLGIFDGDSEHSKSTSRGYVVQLKPLRLSVSIQPDKQLYDVNEVGQIGIMIKDHLGQQTDPDTLDITFDSDPVNEEKVTTGSYSFKTPPLTEQIHKVIVIADKEEYLRETIFGTVTVSGKISQPVSLSAKLDQQSYGIGDIILITGKVGPVKENTPVLLTVSNPRGAIFKFGQVSLDAEGSFTEEFRIEGPLAGIGEWKATLTYLGTQAVESFEVGEFPTQQIEVSLESSFVVSDTGEQLEKASTNSRVGIETEIRNSEERELSFYYLVQIKDSEGITVKLEWIKGLVLRPNGTVKPAIFWIPDKEGAYTAEIFIWSNLEIVLPLSKPKIVSVDVA